MISHQYDQDTSIRDTKTTFDHRCSCYSFVNYDYNYNLTLIYISLYDILFNEHVFFNNNIDNGMISECVL